MDHVLNGKIVVNDLGSVRTWISKHVFYLENRGKGKDTLYIHIWCLSFPAKQISDEMCYHAIDVGDVAELLPLF